MPKLKISKTVKDRFKVTGTGKIMRRKSGMRHLMSHMRATAKRRNAKPVEVVGKLRKN
jgi:large subunit ribosomal protein L35